MTIRLANRAALPLVTRPVPADAVAVAYTTPVAVAPRLGPLAAVAWKEARFALELFTLDGVDGGTVTVRLKAGAETLAEVVDVSVASGAATVAETVDLATVQGQTAIVLELDVTAAGVADARLQAAGELEVTQPIIDSGC